MTSRPVLQTVAAPVAGPAITFVSDRLTTAGTRPELAGRLTVRDTTREVVLAIDDLDCAGPELRVRAGTRIDRYAFGVIGYRGVAARRLDVRLDVVAVRGVSPCSSRCRRPCRR